jgi:CheY-like chemotaxis protein
MWEACGMSGVNDGERIQQLQNLLAEMTLKEQQARRRWSAFLHDELAQILVVCKMKLSRLAETDDTTSAKITGELADALDMAIQLTRGLMSELSPASLYDGGLAAAARALSLQLQRRNFTLHVNDAGFAATLPSRTSILLFYVLQELVENVVRHAGVGQAEVRIRREDGVLLLQVRDTGKGFDAGKRGIGLLTARERVEAVDGTLTITSTPGSGTNVDISVPLELGTERRGDIRMDVSAPSAAARDAKIRIMVADDHALVREGLRRMIRTLSDVELIGEAANGEEAVEQAMRLRPEAILMDINMPKMTGIEATRIIKRDLPEVVIIGLTLHDDEDILAAFREAGASECITKGGRAEELHEVLLTALGPQ